MNATLKFLSGKKFIILALFGGLLLAGGGFWALARLLPGLSGLPGVVTVTPLPSAAPATGSQTGSVSATATPAAHSPSLPKGGVYSMLLRLSEGQAQPQAFATLPPATGEPLSPEEIAAILARLPELTPLPGEQVDFKLPTELLPPPRPGSTVSEQFPPLETAPTPAVAESGPLQVLRFAPEGEIPVVPFISVTFSQPMVPLGTLADLAAEAVPVQVEPALPGTWRWLGTKTLTFEYDSALIDRLPKATEYIVRIPAGIKSATGGVLADPVSWTFKTPAPKVVTTYPDGNQPQPLTPLFFVAFDQRIDPAAVLETVQVTAGSRSASLVLASQAEIEKNETVSQLVKNTPKGRWLAFRASEPFPAETGISVNIGPGTPSAEGPLSTQTVQSYSFSTYAPLRIEANGCGWSDQCPPLTPFYIRFNNPLDPQSFSENLLTITPEIPGLTVNAYGNNIDLSGETKGRTTYTVTVSGEIQDIFGQKLGRDAQLTFKVGAADPVLVGPQQIFVTLDPAAAKPVFSVYSLNYSKLNVKIYAVQPTDWPAFQQYLREWQQTDKTPQMPGKIVRDDSLVLNTPADTLTQVDLSLGDYLKDGFGQFVVVVEPPKPFFELENDKWRRYSQTVHAWVQVTEIGLDALTDHSEMVAWATALKDGAPLAGVQIQPEKGGAQAITGADGTIRFDIPSGASYLVARQGADQALLPYSNGYWGEAGWQTNPPSDELRWYVFDDRQMYKPGEEVHLKGWLRHIGGRQNGDVGLVGDLVSSISYQVTDPQGNSLTSGEAKVNALGGFDFALTIPQTTNLGTAQIALTAQGSLGGLSGAQSYHALQIQEFRRPEFEVTARNETSGPYFAGDHAVLAVEAKYYGGGALPNAEVTWQVNSAPGNYSPPNWPEFSFGAWTPWWYYDYGYPGGNGGGQTETFTGKTDASGIHYLRLDFDQQGDPTNGPRPVSINAYATVMDVNRQGWTSSTSLLVHPADVYIGLRSERYFVEKGTPLKIEYIVTDLDGQPVSGRPVEISAARLEWKIRQGNWAEEAVDVQKCTQTSASEPGSCEFATPVGGTYQITALVTDEKGRQNQSQFTRWVSGSQRPPSRKVEQEQVTLIPDKQTYQPGDVAEILVQAPFSPASGLLTVTRSGILYTERFQIDSGSYTLKIPIKDAYTPNLNIQVDLTGSAPRTDDQGALIAGLTPRPAYAMGTLTLNIPPAQRTLALEVTPDQARLEPGGETTLTVQLKDASGQPVPDAELAVVVVDEAILALTNYQLADPLTVFYTARPADLNSLYGRASLILADPQALATQALSRTLAADALAGAAPAAAPMATQALNEAAPLPKTGGGGADVEPAPIAVRTDFNPLAAFVPEARTGLDGTARISVKLPDNLTRYRVMVVAVDNGGQKFGTGASNLTARLPLMVRPSAPRFLNFGDKFELPVVLQNQTDSPLEVSVVARSANLELTESLNTAENGFKVTVPANDRVEVRFPAASLLAGTARVQFAAVSGTYADAATVELPVYTPATTEAFATYGVVDEGALAQPVQYPTGVFPQYGGLEINTSSTALQALTDAVLYLVAYPYECSEQLASRILAVAALRDVLTAFEADGLPSPAEMESAVNRDLTRLQGMQNEDGGFPYWRRGFESSPFNSLHVAHALARAKQKGFEIPAGMQENALTYLREIENHYPSWYGQQTRWTLSAYALYVRNLSGDRDAAKALALLNEAGLENLPLQALGWLWPVLDDPGQLDGIRRYVNNHVVETAGAANFTTSYDDQSYLLLSSDRRTDAVLLEALIQDSPQSDLIPKLVNGLLAHRTKGRWGNTQENVFVLLALDKYFNTYEATTPDFVAKLWLGNTYAGSSEFRGRTTERHETLIPMNYVLAETAAGGGTQDLILNKDGPGRLYYRLGLRYAPTDLNLKPLEMGFTVQRRYESVDDPKDVYQAADGAWHIKAGARVRVKIEMVTENRRYHVALVDPLPAGLEIVNPALAVSGSVPQDPNDTSVRYGWWWWGPWYEHQNLRDDRAEAFTPLLWDGVYNYSYIARATTPGTFIVPPAKVEEMYSPEVFGRSSSDWVIVE